MPLSRLDSTGSSSGGPAPIFFSLFSFFFFLKQINVLVFSFISKLNDRSEEIRKIISYHIKVINNPEKIRQVSPTRCILCKLRVVLKMVNQCMENEECAV